MFDIGFTELLLVGVVALVVVGPERLPALIRTTLRYVRQFKSGFAHIRDEVEREMHLDDLKKDWDDSKEKVSKAVGYDELHQSLDELKKESESLREIADDGYEYAEDFHDDHVSDAEIEADLDELVGPQRLPDPDAEADTGIEQLLKKPKIKPKKTVSW